MGEKVKSGFCKVCEGKTRVTRPTPNHILHLILSICTAGVWIVMWLLLTFTKIGSYRCVSCGTKQVEGVH